MHNFYIYNNGEMLTFNATDEEAISGSFSRQMQEAADHWFPDFQVASWEYDHRGTYTLTSTSGECINLRAYPEIPVDHWASRMNNLRPVR